MPLRSVWLTETTSNVSFSLSLWNRGQPRPRGKVFVGSGDGQRGDFGGPSGIEIAYLSPTLAAIAWAGAEVSPTVAIRIRTKMDGPRAEVTAISTHLQSGVSQFWLIDPYERTVVVYRPDQEPIMLDGSENLNGEPELPGYMVPVLSFFEDIDP